MCGARNLQYEASRRVGFLSFACNCLFSVIFNKTGNVYINVILRLVRVCWKNKSVTYSEFVSVALAFQHVKRMRSIVICCLSGCVIFFHVIAFSEDVA